MKLYLITHSNDKYVVEASDIQTAIDYWIKEKEKDYYDTPRRGFKPNKFSIEELVDVKAIIKASE